MMIEVWQCIWVKTETFSVYDNLFQPEDKKIT